MAVATTTTTVFYSCPRNYIVWCKYKGKEHSHLEIAKLIELSGWAKRKVVDLVFNEFIQQMSDDIPYLSAVVMDIIRAIDRFIGSGVSTNSFQARFFAKNNC